MFRRRLKKTGNYNKNRYKLTEERKWKEKKREKNLPPIQKQARKAKTQKERDQQKAGMVDLSSIIGVIIEI